VKKRQNKALCQVIEMLRHDELVVSVVAVKEIELGMNRVILLTGNRKTAILF
jgi:hypothetical protein